MAVVAPPVEGTCPVSGAPPTSSYNEVLEALVEVFSVAFALDSASKSANKSFAGALAACLCSAKISAKGEGINCLGLNAAPSPDAVALGERFKGALAAAEPVALGNSNAPPEGAKFGAPATLAAPEKFKPLSKGIPPDPAACVAVLRLAETKFCESWSYIISARPMPPPLAISLESSVSYMLCQNFSSRPTKGFSCGKVARICCHIF